MMVLISTGFQRRKKETVDLFTIVLFCSCTDADAISFYFLANVLCHYFGCTHIPAHKHEHIRLIMSHYFALLSFGPIVYFFSLFSMLE